MSFWNPFLNKKKRQRAETTIHAAGVSIPTVVHLEPRNGYRVSFGKNGMIVRLPWQITATELNEKMAFAADFAQKVLDKKPQLLAQHTPKIYESGQILTVGKRKYQLEIELTDLATHSATLSDGVIYLKLSRKTSSQKALNNSIQTLLSRVVGKDFMPELKRRVHEINHQHFKKEIEKISLKYNASNWGSCSTGRNLNFSTRLLFAPDDVIDYIIVHELAHLVEMNHSNRFWAVVERAMPNYVEKEKWLKVHGAGCDF